MYEYYRMFQSPMYIMSEIENHDFKAKETYAYQFMMLFLPFRTIDDLIHEGCNLGCIQPNRYNRYGRYETCRIGPSRPKRYTTDTRMYISTAVACST